MFCENCGNQIPDDSTFCEECGTRMEPDTPIGIQNNISVTPPSATPVHRMQQQVPGYAPQPVVGNYNRQPMQQPYPAKKTPVGLIIGIFAAVVVIGVGGFFGIRALIGKSDPVPETGESISESSSVSDIAITPEIPENTPEPELQQQNPDEDIVVTPEIQEDTPEPELQAENPYEDYRGYANGDEVSIGDFFWFTEEVKWDGLPISRTALIDFDSIAGYWKAYTETIPMFEGEGEYLKWFNVEISGDDTQAVFIYHTVGFTAFNMETGRIDDISADDGFSLNGRFSDGQLFVGDRDTKGLEINIKNFYTLDGNQYAVGEISYISGEKENIVLVRP